jgi:hypothetical protein
MGTALTVAYIHSVASCCMGHPSCPGVQGSLIKCHWDLIAPITSTETFIGEVAKAIAAVILSNQAGFIRH